MYSSCIIAMQLCMHDSQCIISKKKDVRHLTHPTVAQVATGGIIQLLHNLSSSP